jgi:L-amino acid N-acyltransferase YncA
MSTTITETFRHVTTLRDGARILLRPMVADDVEGLFQMYSQASQEDMLSLRDDVFDKAVIQAWADNLDYSRVLPLLANINNQLVGNATLHRKQGPYRHIGEVRIFLAKDFRGRGLGTEMLKTLIDLARKEGLHQLRAEVFASTPKVIRAFESLGFERGCALEDYFMLPDNKTEDIVLLMMKLLKRVDEF